MPETTRQSLYPYIELFCHALDLVDRQDERLNKLTRALHSSLGLYGLYYELKQGSSGLEIDLSCEIPLYVDKESFSAALLELDIPGSWQDMLQEMLSPQSTSCSAKPKISMMGLEFDSHCPSALKPSIFFTAPQGEGPNIQWLRAIMHEIQRTGYSLHGIHDRLNALHNALHAPSHVVHAGFMLPRGNNGAVKIILSGISTQQLSLLAEILDFNLSHDLYAVWEKMTAEARNMHLALDFVPGRAVKPAWEIFAARNKHSSNDKWKSLLQLLPDYGPEYPEKIKTKPCVQTWIAYDLWPLELKEYLVSHSEVKNSLMVTKLNHVKVFDDYKGNMQYKCYYYQCPVFQTSFEKLIGYRQMPEA